MITYTNLKSDSIKTVATSAIIATREYKTPKYMAQQKWFRDCFYEHLIELQETPNMHQKWQEVDPNDHGVWEWYDLPTASPNPVATTPVSVPAAVAPKK